MEIKRSLLILPEVRELVSLKDSAELREILAELEPVEAAEIARELSFQERIAFFSLLDPELAAEIFSHMEPAEQIELLEKIDREKSARLLAEVEPDDRADILASLPEEMEARFLKVLDDEERKETEELLSYPANTAGGRMTTKFAWTTDNSTVGQTLDTLRRTGKDAETIYYIYVLDRYRRLAGVTSLKTLVLADPGAPISTVMDTNVISVPLEMDQEEVAREIQRYDFLALPVVDSAHRMRGIITVDDLMDVVQEEQTEDIYRLGAAGAPVGEYISQKPFFLASRRINWLVILVAIGFVSGFVMEKYRPVLSQVVTLAFFVPLLMDSAGNAGTQSATIVVRGLALGEIQVRDIWRVASKELVIGGILGCFLGLFAIVRAVAFKQGFELGIVVCLAMVLSVMIATTVGALLPILFQRLKVDPAVASGPLLTTVADIVVLIVYFEIAKRLLLSGGGP